jgi:hypothetical protein
MTVFSNRIRTAYVRKRSKRSMAAATLLLMLVSGLFSFAASQDEKDLQSVASDFSPVLRKQVVSTWASTDIVPGSVRLERGR